MTAEVLMASPKALREVADAARRIDEAWSAGHIQVVDTAALDAMDDNREALLRAGLRCPDCVRYGGLCDRHFREAP
jgi:hypothetical protein